MLRGQLEAALPGEWSLREEADTSAERAFLSTLYAGTRADELSVVAWPQEQKDAFLQQQFRLQRQHYRQHYADAGFWIIEHRHRSAGRLYVFDGPSEVRLMDIALVPACQRQGIGTALVRALQDHAARCGKSLTLHVEPANPVKRLYRRLGFTIEAERGAYQFLRWIPPGAGVGGIN